MLAYCSAYSQNAALTFCTHVNSPTQECVFENTKFITTPDSTHAKLFMFFHGRVPIGAGRLTYKVYAIDRFGNEVFLRDVNQDVQAEWLTAWQPDVFTSPGKYMVKVLIGTQEMVSRGFEFFNN